MRGDELAVVNPHGADLVVPHPDPGMRGARGCDVEVLARLQDNGST